MSVKTTTTHTIQIGDYDSGNGRLSISWTEGTKELHLYTSFAAFGPKKIQELRDVLGDVLAKWGDEK